MVTLRWERYPSVARLDAARTWLWMQHDLQLAPKTLDAYGRSLNDYLAFCDRAAVDPETASRAHLARYVADLTTRPCPARQGLANATIQLRLTVVRLFYDHLIEDGVREDNPVGRGRYTPGNAFAGKRERGLLARYQRLPWIPGDDQWQALLRAVRDEPLRNRAMFVLAYDGALRREELVTVQIGDLDFAHRHVRLRAERTKNGVARVVTFSQTTGALLVAYQRVDWRKGKYCTRRATRLSVRWNVQRDAARRSLSDDPSLGSMNWWDKVRSLHSYAVLTP
jgi:integrase/recombinase XerD